MAVYRFRITFEDHEEITREIDIRSDQTFEDLHFAILQSINFDTQHGASFYVSSDQWIKGKEISLESRSSKKYGVSTLMRDALLLDWVNDPHQKFYYQYDYSREWSFFVELIRIFMNEDFTKTYPHCVKFNGSAPNQYIQTPAPKPARNTEEDEESIVVDDLADETSSESENELLYDSDETPLHADENLTEGDEEETASSEDGSEESYEDQEES